MGNFCCSENTRRNVVLLLVGLDNAGKTVTVKGLAGENIEDSVPTVGFSVINLKYYDTKVTIYDLGGGEDIRGIWPRYFVDAHGIIFVIDSSDYNRLDEAKNVLRDLLSDKKIAGKPVLILANKQDAMDALDEIDLAEKLELEKLVNEMKCPTLLETSSAKSKKIDPGIKIGYQWIMNTIIRDFDELNTRVIVDSEEQKLLFKERHKITKVKSFLENDADSLENTDPFRPIDEILAQKPKPNRISSAISSKSYLNRSKINSVRPKSAVDIVKRQLVKNNRRSSILALLPSNKTAPVSLFTPKIVSNSSKFHPERVNSIESTNSYLFTPKKDRSHIKHSSFEVKSVSPNLQTISVSSKLHRETSLVSDVSSKFHREASLGSGVSSTVHGKPPQTSEDTSLEMIVSSKLLGNVPETSGVSVKLYKNSPETSGVSPRVQKHLFVHQDVSSKIHETPETSGVPSKLNKNSPETQGVSPGIHKHSLETHGVSSKLHETSVVSSKNYKNSPETQGVSSHRAPEIKKFSKFNRSLPETSQKRGKIVSPIFHENTSFFSPNFIVNENYSGPLSPKHENDSKSNQMIPDKIVSSHSPEISRNVSRTDILQSGSENQEILDLSVSGSVSSRSHEITAPPSSVASKSPEISVLKNQPSKSPEILETGDRNSISGKLENKNVSPRIPGSVCKDVSLNSSETSSKTPKVTYPKTQTILVTPKTPEGSLKSTNSPEISRNLPKSSGTIEIYPENMPNFHKTNGTFSKINLDSNRVQVFPKNMPSLQKSLENSKEPYSQNFQIIPEKLPGSRNLAPISKNYEEIFTIVQSSNGITNSKNPNFFGNDPEIFTVLPNSNETHFEVFEGQNGGSGILGTNLDRRKNLEDDLDMILKDIS